MGWGEEIHSLTLVTPEIDTHRNTNIGIGVEGTLRRANSDNSRLTRRGAESPPYNYTVPFANF